MELFICTKMNLALYNGWFAIKPNEPTSLADRVAEDTAGGVLTWSSAENP